MQLPKKKAQTVLAAVTTLQADRVISTEVAEAIRGHIETISFDWRRLARYAFIAALSCLVIAIFSALFDAIIIRWLERLLPVLIRFFHAPPPVRASVLTALSAVIFWFGLKRRARFPDRLYSNEAIFTGGVLGIAAAVFTLSQMLQYEGRATYLLTLAGAIYLLLGAGLSSKVVWGYGLFTLSAAIGSGTGYTMGGYYLWQDSPILSLGYGLSLVGIAEWLFMNPVQKAPIGKLQFVNDVTRVVGLLHVFISLWILSIWGHAHYRYHSADFRWDCLIWALLFGTTAVVAVARALQKDDAVLRGFGLTFFFINLYTAFFQYFWDELHKTIFFAILGVSFWLLGRKAETLWHLKSLRERSLLPSRPPEDNDPPRPCD